MAPLRSPSCSLRVVALAWLLVRVNHAHAADVCASTGLPSPDVVTAVISPRNPDTDVWILGPNCDWNVGKVYLETIFLAGRGIERVESLPKAQVVDLMRNPLSRGADLTNVSNIINLSAISTKLFDNIIFTSFTGLLSISDSTLTSLSRLALPDKLVALNITQTKLKTLKDAELPSTLTRLIVSSSNLKALDFTLPPLLTDLANRFLQTNHFSTSHVIQNVEFPDSVRTLEFAGSKVATVKGVTWPSQLDYLGLGGNPLVEFEIRSSDVQIFKLLTSFTANTSQAKCSDETATPTLVKSMNLCVISDERFELLYRSTPASPTPSPKVKTTKKPSVASNGSMSSTSEDEDDTDQEDEDASTLFPESSAETETNEPGSATPSPANETTASDTSQPPAQNGSDEAESGSRTTKKTTVIQTKSSSTSSTPTIVFGVCSGLAAMALGAWILRSCVIAKRKRRRGEDTTSGDKYTRVHTPGSTGVNESAESFFQEYLANDVRNDRSMTALRISQKDITLRKQVARGGYGVIYKGVYQDQDVAVKQMLPGTWQDDQVLASFMAEIRLCATLDHPKIVSFVGIAYSSLRDLSVVIEFMPGGDLHVLLQKQQDLPRSAQDWSRPWTSSKIKCKASIGQDVAEAVAYLHAHEKPIIHRDLKARNVLLDLDGNAKLSDFGISRELTIDETMTSEVGTAAWIAPEVLRGARYSEKADIYSLGVLLVELDRCQHPYAGEPVLQQGGGASVKPSTMSHVAQKNTQIAVLVSTGKLRPSVSSECPAHVAELVAQCLSFDPEDRPSAAEVAKAFDKVTHS